MGFCAVCEADYGAEDIVAIVYVNQTAFFLSKIACLHESKQAFLCNKTVVFACKLSMSMLK